MRANELLDTPPEGFRVHDAIVPLPRKAASLRRSATVILVVVAAVSGAAPAASTDRPSGQSACADLVRYHGALFAGTFVGRAVRVGQHVRAVRLGCADGPGGTVKNVGTRLAQIRGVAPSLALLADDNARHVYLVAGVFPENPNHPLHIALYGNRARPDDCQGAVLGSLRVRGTVSATPLPFNPLSVRTASGSRPLIVDAWTRLDYPYTRRLVKGNRVQVVAARCRAPNTTRAVVVARRIDLR
jgi:hypothetical protein